MARERAVDLRHGPGYPKVIAAKAKFKAAVARSLGLEPENILPSHAANGALKAVIDFCAFCELDGGNKPRVLIEDPTYFFTQACLARRKYDIARVSSEDFASPVDEYLHMLDSGMSFQLVIITSPNNPTGSALTQDQLFGILSKVPRSTLCMVDRTLITDDPAYDFRTSDILTTFSDHRIVVVHSLSKPHDLAVERVGYAVVTNPELLASIEGEFPMGLNVRSLEIAAQALDDDSIVEAKRSKIRESHEVLTAGTADLDCTYHTSHSLFALISVPEDRTDVCDQLIAEDVNVMPGPDIGLPANVFRVYMGGREDSEVLVEALKDILKNPPR